jgi:hypothetical protein
MNDQLEPEVTSSTNLPAHEVIAQLRAHRLMQFIDYLTANWPPWVSEECASAFADTDCIEMKMPEEMYCEACKVYAQICRQWYALPEVQQRMSA